MVPALVGGELAMFRLFSWALPSLASPLGGFIYDRFGVAPLVFEAVGAVLALACLRRGLLVLGFLATLMVSLLGPGVRALLGRLVYPEPVGCCCEVEHHFQEFLNFEG